MNTIKAKVSLLALGALLSTGILAQQAIPKVKDSLSLNNAVPGDGVSGDIDDPFLSQVEKKVAKLSVYPNPGNGVLQFNGQILEGVQEVKVINLTGQIEFCGKIDGVHLKNESLDLSQLKRGVYLIHIGEKVLKYQKL